MADRDRIDITITLAYQAHKVNEPLDKTINAIKETK